MGCIFCTGPVRDLSNSFEVKIFIFHFFNLLLGKEPNYVCAYLRSTSFISDLVTHPGGGGVVAMFAYNGVLAMFLGLKFHLKAIFWGSKICNMNFPILGGKKLQQLSFFSIQFCNTSKIVSCHQIYD